MNGQAVMTNRATIHALWSGEYDGAELLGLFTSPAIADRAELQAWRAGKERVHQEPTTFEGEIKPGQEIHVVWKGAYADRALVGIYATQPEAAAAELGAWRDGGTDLESEPWCLDADIDE